MEPEADEARGGLELSFDFAVYLEEAPELQPAAQLQSGGHDSYSTISHWNALWLSFWRLRPVSDVVSLLGGLGGGGVGGSLEFVHVEPPLGDLGEGLVAGAAVSDQPASDYGSRAPDSGPAVDVDGLAILYRRIYGVQGGGHEFGAIGDAEVTYGVSPVFDGEAEGLASSRAISS